MGGKKDPPPNVTEGLEKAFFRRSKPYISVGSGTVQPCSSFFIGRTSTTISFTRWASVFVTVTWRFFSSKEAPFSGISPNDPSADGIIFQAIDSIIKVQVAEKIKEVRVLSIGIAVNKIRMLGNLAKR